MKLAACYTVFDGTELLKKSIETIAPHVDFFVVCYQEISNKGEKMHDRDWQNIMGIWNNPKVLICQYTSGQYATDTTLNPKENERRKHKYMVDYARVHGATHFMMAACDHFYEPKEFETAKQKAIHFDSTFTAMYTYYKKPTWQLTPIETYFMPFICKLYPHTKIERVRPFPLLVDPSVQMNTVGKWYQFEEKEIMLHHYSMVRSDIHGKFLNAASPWKPEQVEAFSREVDGYNVEENPGVKYFHGRKIKIVPDYFGLSHIFDCDKT